MRAGGLEPPRPYGQQILSLACLPIPPRSHLILNDLNEWDKVRTATNRSKISVRDVPIYKRFVNRQFPVYPKKLSPILRRKLAAMAKPISAPSPIGPFSISAKRSDPSGRSTSPRNVINSPSSVARPAIGV